MKRNISVLGCGWLGLPLAQELVKQGHHVKGSTTTPEKLSLLEENGIEPFLLSFPEKKENTLLDFLSSEVLIFNVPPSRIMKEKGDYERMVKEVLDMAPPSLTHVLFISSTSVYPELNRDVLEEDALSSSETDNLMLRSEYLFQNKKSVLTTVVRFGGLMGGQRHPGRWFASKAGVPQPDAPVNMIHLTDCIQILLEIIEQEKWGYTFNACAPSHPTRQEFYTRAAISLGLTPPSFISTTEVTSFKRINSDFLQKELHYAFRFPDPLDCLTAPDF